MKKIIKPLTLALFFICAIASAQQKDSFKIKRNETGAITFVEFVLSKERAMSNAKEVLKKILNVGRNDEFRLQEETTDKYGITHLRFHQYYKGIKVEGAEYLIHGEKGLIGSMNGHYQKVNLSSTSPQMTEKKALEKPWPMWTRPTSIICYFKIM